MTYFSSKGREGERREGDRKKKEEKGAEEGKGSTVESLSYRRYSCPISIISGQSTIEEVGTL